MKIKQEPIVAGQPVAVPPVYFHSLTISGVKCFRDATKFSFADERGRPVQWTVILGENGVGKTTVLQCLAGMSATSVDEPNDPLLPPLRPLMSQGMEWLEWKRNSHCADEMGDWDLDATATVFVGSPLSDAPTGLLQSWNFHRTQQRGEISGLNDIPGAEPELFGGFRCYGYGAGRRMAVTSRLPFATVPEDAVRTLMGDGEPLSNAEEWLLELDHAAKTDHPNRGHAKRQKAEVEELLIQVLPDISGVRIVVPEGPTTLGIVRAQFKTPYGWVGIGSLSFGYQTMVSWLVDLTRRLYQRYPESENPIGEPAIVLVDEIDLHLHPKWQQTVMDYLSERFVNTQFIVTAHSPLIIQSQRAANVILLQREGNKVVARQDLDAIKQWRVDQILTSDLFGLERTRPPEIEKLYDERSKLLGKAKLTAAQHRRLNALNAQIHQLPTGETEEMREVEKLLREVAKDINGGRPAKAKAR